MTSSHPLTGPLSFLLTLMMLFHSFMSCSSISFINLHCLNSIVLSLCGSRFHFCTRFRITVVSLCKLSHNTLLISGLHYFQLLSVSIFISMSILVLCKIPFFDLCFNPYFSYDGRHILPFFILQEKHQEQFKSTKVTKAVTYKGSVINQLSLESSSGSTCVWDTNDHYIITRLLQLMIIQF